MQQEIFEIVATHDNGYRELIGKAGDLSNARGRARGAYETNLSIKHVRVLRLTVKRTESFYIGPENKTLRLFP